MSESLATSSASDGHEEDESFTNYRTRQVDHVPSRAPRSNGPASLTPSLFECRTENLDRIRYMTKVIVCAAKIGDDVVIDIQPDLLTFRVVNSTKSVCMELEIQRSFFDSYHLEARRSPETTETIVLSTKLLIPISKALLSASQLVITCSSSSFQAPSVFKAMDGDEQSSRGSELAMVFNIVSKLGVLMSFSVPYEVDDGMVMQLVASPDDCPSRMAVRPRHITELLGNFYTKLNEISFFVSRESGFKVKSFVDQAGDIRTRAVRTEVSLDGSEFEEFNINGSEEVELTFSLKPFRAVLEFGEAFDNPLYTHFARSGEPIFFCLSDNLRVGLSTISVRFGFSTRHTTPQNADGDVPLISTTVRAPRLPSHNESLGVSRTGPGQPNNVHTATETESKGNRASGSRGSSMATGDGEEEFVAGTPPLSPNKDSHPW